MNLGKSYIDRSETMYPSVAYQFDSSEVGDMGYFFTKDLSTSYGYVFEGSVTLPNKTVTAGEYFCLWTTQSTEIKYQGKLSVFMRIGFRGQDMIGGPVESKGRLTYIDGCSDSILIYPPRQSDPSLNLLHFPPNIKQTWHTHPSLRFGIVIAGCGYAATNRRINLEGEEEENRYLLEKGMMFCIEEQELHRFVTENQTMTVIAFHPDGDWGPTDHNHSMINRTYLAK
jgi:quercetin dioxygenase-like cupin family protein